MRKVTLVFNSRRYEWFGAGYMSGFLSGLLLGSLASRRMEMWQIAACTAFLAVDFVLGWKRVDEH